MKSLIFFVAASLAVSTLAANLSGCPQYTLDVENNQVDETCPSQFDDHLGCSMPQIEEAVDNIIASSTGSANERTVNDCFDANGCDRTTFDRETALDTILPCDCEGESQRKKNCVYRHAADTVIGLLDSIPKSVGKCMTEYFKELAQKMLQDCARDADFSPVVPPYTQQIIPGLENLNIDDLSDVIVFQVMVRYNLLTCKSCNSNAGSSSQIAQCLSKVVVPTANVCSKKQQCIDNSFGTSGSCLARYNGVTKSVCSCVQATMDRYSDFSNIDINDPKTKKQLNELKKIFGNDMKKRLEVCYKSTYDGECHADKWNGANGMKKQYTKTMSAVIKAILKFTQGKVSDQLLDMLYVAKSVITDLTTKWGDAFCGDCVQKDEAAITAQALVDMVNAKSGSCASVTADASDSCGEGTGSGSSAFNQWFGK